VNYFCESTFSRKVGGIHSAFVSIREAVNRTDQVRCHTNVLGSRGILHVHTSGPRYWVARSLHRGKVVIHAHVIPETFVGQVRGTSLYMPLLRRYFRAFFNSADIVICMTEVLQAQLWEMGVHRPVVVMKYPLDLTTFRQSPELRHAGRRRLGLDPAQRVVLGVGMMVPRKGIFDFAQVAHLNPDVQFVWVGDIPHAIATAARGQIKQLARTGPPNLSFPGVFSLAEMPAIYNAADLFFFPSYQETFGLAIAEAAACGLPLLLRNLDTYRESFGTSYLVGEHPSQFSRTIRDTIFSEQMLQQWGEAAQAVAQAHDSQQIGARLAGLYRDLLREAGAVVPQP
jgi:1,2-diacylglycerol-3-alpha-glucose alpha-1,2-galactosyltransferase